MLFRLLTGPALLRLSSTAVVVARLATLCLLLITPVRLAGAQGSGPFDLVPEKWHPMALGDAWYYSDDINCGLPLIYEWVNRVVADTTVDGRRWARIKTVWTSPNLPCPPQFDNWWSFSPDHYLVATRQGFRPGPNARLDTLFKTPGRSVFTARSANELFDNAGRCAFRDNAAIADVRPAYDRRLVLRHEESGSVRDSTNFVLVVNNDGGSSSLFCAGYYIYKIGPARYLKGATIGGLRWGDAAFIERLVASDAEAAPAARHVTAYPNPSRGVLRVQTGATPFPRLIRVYDVVGRLAFEQPAASTGITSLDLRGRLAPGAYLIHVIERGQPVARSPFVLVE